MAPMHKLRQKMLWIRELPDRNFRMNIRKKMTLIVLSISIATLLVMSIIMFYGMFGARNMAIRYGGEIGYQSDLNSSGLLEEQKRKELIDIASDKAADIDQRLAAMEKPVRLAAATMQKIHATPQDFLPQNVGEPPASGAGKIVFYLQYAPTVDAKALEPEIRMSANIRDVLLGIVECDPIIDSIFVASRHNYTLSVDNELETSPEEYNPPDIFYDALASDWYRLAAEKRDLVFTPVRQFVFSKKLGIFCALPYYDENGELEGVACLQSTLKGLGHIVDRVNLHNMGFCCVIDERGHVIAFSNKKNNHPLKTLSVDLETDLRQSENTGLADTVADMVSGGNGVADIDIDGGHYYLAFAPIRHTGWSFVAAIAKDDAMAPVAWNHALIRQSTKDNIHLLDNHMLNTMAMASILVLGLLGAVFLVGKKLSDRFVDPIHILSDGVREIAAGNLDKKIHIDTGDEIEHLANCFNDMTASLKTYTENLAHAKTEQERQNDLLRKKNEELSAALHDVKCLRIARDNYRTKSEIDDLTRLYNKATMEQLCEQRCRELPDGKQVALYIIDLDHFKEANDTFGHQFGDQILAEFAFQLKRLCRAEDFAGRFGGDEFVLMIEGNLTEDIIKKKAQAIWQAAREIHVNGEPTAITASIGIAIAPLHGTDYTSLFKAADNALYHVKKHGRDGFRIGNP